MTARIPTARPYLGAEEEAAVIAVLRSGWISQGPRSVDFENAMAAFIGVAYGRAVNSGTSAIHLALLACGVRPGDAVIVPAFTCVAALHPIAAIGARIVLVDIEPQSYGIDPHKLEQAITPATRAVMATHLFGYAARIEEIASIANHHGLRLIEDVALSIGARIGGRHVGTYGDAAILSFHPRKTITTGEGGMVLSQSQEIADQVAAMRNYGASVPAWKRHQTGIASLPEYNSIGFNYKMTDIQAAIGLEQARKLEEILGARTRIARRYDEGLHGIPWFATPSRRQGETHGNQFYVCRCLGAQGSLTDSWRLRDRLVDHLDAHGIATVQGAQAMSEIAYYSNRCGWIGTDFPNALAADRTTIALPIFPGLSEPDQDSVIAAVRSFDARAFASH